jgi:ABC-type cobalt transport system substrate-binding protein
MTTETNNRSTMIVMIIAIIALMAIVAYAVTNAQEHRTPSQKVGDAFNNISDGFKDAGRSLENRTPAEKAGDALQDAGESLKRSSK